MPPVSAPASEGAASPNGLDLPRQVMRASVPGDLCPRRGPDAIVLSDVIQKAEQPHDASRPAREAAMQADTHHPRPAL